MFSPRGMITLGMVVGGFVGGWVPTLWGASGFSFASLAGSTIGGLAGIWIAWKLTR